MRCCVPLCKNDSRHLSKSEGITFHVFPSEPSLRRRWLRALGKEDWEPRERSAVCSEHFHPADLYETKSGLRRVSSGAAPVVTQTSSNGDFLESSSLEVCRTCLASAPGSKLTAVSAHYMLAQLEQITGIAPPEITHDRLPRRLCVECSRELSRAARFRRKSRAAHALLTAQLERLPVTQELTLQMVRSIDRDAHKLTSPLMQFTFPEPCDLHLTYDDTTHSSTELRRPPSLHEVNIRLDIKREDSDLELSRDGLARDVIADGLARDVIADGFARDVIADDAGTDRDCVQSEHSDGSDSVPINQLKQAKAKAKSTKKKKTTSKPVKKRPPKQEASEPKVDRRRRPLLNEDLNETLFTVLDLSFEEQCAEIQKRQESSNYKNAVYKCTECFKGFLDGEAYEGHMVRHTDQCGLHACAICKTHFLHAHALRKHITAHHTQRFSCNCCPYVTTHRQTARLHERWHKGTKYKCPHCQDEFVKFTTYMGHVRIKHPSDFVCALCGYSYVSAKGIELHKQLKHRLDARQIPADGPLCALCDVRFVSWEAHARHIQVSPRHAATDKEPKKSNAPNRPRKPRDPAARERRPRERRSRDSGSGGSAGAGTGAGAAGEKRRYPSQLRRAEGPIPCEQCGMQLEDSRAYHGHFRRAHPDKNRTNYPSMKSPCMCELCGRMFQSYALLKDHTWTHTGEKPFKCELCAKSFRMKQRLVAHRRVHSQQRATYVCSVCGKHFSTHSNRQRHMFIHTGLKPFKCEMCGKCFKHASEKRAHVTYVHLKKPWPKRARSKRQQGQPEGSPPHESETALAPAMWPACAEPKMPEHEPMSDEHKMYYNLKI